MAQLDVSQTTVTDLAGTVDDYEVDSVTLDSGEGEGEKVWVWSEAPEKVGYYKNIPELKKAVDALITWVVGKGFEVESSRDEVILKRINGWGVDSFQSILENMMIMKKVVGDSFAEIIRNEKGELLNLKPLDPSKMRLVVGKNGIIKRYEQITKDGHKKYATSDILHLCNDRIGDEIHGVSIIDACKWVIDARNEVMEDHRKVIHRNVVPVRIIEVDTDNVEKRNKLIAEYQDAINKGEVLVIPKGAVEIKDNNIVIQDPTNWIQYLENFFYQAVGVPRVIATSENYTEASSKVGFLTFEPIYTREQTLLEADLWNQLALKIKFNKPPSLAGMMRKDEAKNTGQTGFQPKEAALNMEAE